VWRPGSRQPTLARLFFRLEANLPGPHRSYAKGLLATITPGERWGIPRAIGHGWSVWFKGGWRQAGQEDTSGPVNAPGRLLVHRGGERVALAVLTDEPPGALTGFGAIEVVAERLRPRRRPTGGGGRPLNGDQLVRLRIWIRVDCRPGPMLSGS